LLEIPHFVTKITYNAYLFSPELRIDLQTVAYLSKSMLERIICWKYFERYIHHFT